MGDGSMGSAHVSPLGKMWGSRSCPRHPIVPQNADPVQQPSSPADDFSEIVLNLIAYSRGSRSCRYRLYQPKTCQAALGDHAVPIF
jgi:hypothetical protein